MATLAEFVSDPKIAANLALDEKQPYRLRPADFQKVTAWIEDSPLYLSQRARFIELDLAGDNSLVLSVDASGLAKELSAIDHVAAVRLWTLPLERLAQKLQADQKYKEASAAERMPFRVMNGHLWKAHMLHLMGNYTGERGAIHYYQLCRPPNDELAAANQGRAVRSQVRKVFGSRQAERQLLAGAGGLRTRPLHNGHRLLEPAPP